MAARRTRAISASSSCSACARSSAFIVAERRANRPFPTIDAITDHMGWPKDGANRQAKDALKRLSAAGKLPIFRKPKGEEA